MERLDILREVFDEKVIKIITTFLENPMTNFTLTDISNSCGTSIATTHRKLGSLKLMDIIYANKKDNKKKIHSYKLRNGEKAEMLSKIFNLGGSNRFSNLLRKLK